jgi:hypothetical protein
LILVFSKFSKLKKRTPVLVFGNFSKKLPINYENQFFGVLRTVGEEGFIYPTPYPAAKEKRKLHNIGLVQT